MKFFHTKNAAYISDLICAALLGAVVLAAFLPVFSPDLGMGDCLLIMTVDLALVFLFTRKWWVLPVVLASASFIFVLIGIIFGLFDTVFMYLQGLIRWSFTGFSDTLPYSADNSITVVRLVLALPVAAVAYLYFQKLFFFPVIPPIVISLILYMYFGKSQLFFAALALLLGVLFISLAKMTGNRIKKRLSDQETSSVFHQISAIIILPFILLFAFILGPSQDGQWRSKGFVRIVDDFGDLLELSGNSSRAQSTYAMSGFSPLGHRLGGNVELNYDVVMRIKTAMPTVLKGAVFDAYSGYSWHDTHELKSHRFNSILWQGLRQEVFGSDKLFGNAEADELYADLTLNLEMNITSLVFGTTVFHAGQVEAIESASLDTEDLFFNRQSEIFIAGAHRRSLRYMLKTRIFDRQLDDFDQNILTLQSLTINKPDHLLDDIKDAYLQLPESLPDSVFAACESITAGYHTPYEKALAIERWLAANCAYTLTPGDPPEGQDFVAHFLQTREGYCVYYASAMTVLARCAGLPARYVTGFALHQDPLSRTPESYVATNATAHAWSEIYFQGIGWLSFDPTGWDFSEYAVTNEITASSNDTDRLPADVNMTDSSDGELHVDDGSDAGIHILIGVILTLLAALMLFACIRIISLLHGTVGYFNRLYRKYKEYSQMMNACYGRIIRQMGFLGFKMQPDDTITSFACRIDRQLGGDAMTAACETIIRVRFALYSPSEDDVMRLCAFSTALEKRLRQKLGLSGYIWRRLLLGR